MTAPFNSCVLMRVKSSSAGGQLEHPSEVNSSTTTAFLWVSPGAGLKANAPSRKTNPNTTMRPPNAGPTTFSNPFHHKIRFFIRHSFLILSCHNYRINQLSVTVSLPHQLNALREFTEFRRQQRQQGLGGTRVFRTDVPGRNYLGSQFFAVRDLQTGSLNLFSIVLAGLQFRT